MAFDDVIFTPEAISDLDNLDQKTAQRIIKKIEWYVQLPKPLPFASKLSLPFKNEFRYRVGEYRVIFTVNNNIIKILAVGHRSDIYK